MPSLLEPGQHHAVVHDQGTQLLELVIAAGLDAPVPTCPDWTAADLLGHQGRIHRWATGHLRRPAPDPADREDYETVPADPRARPDWYRDGLAALVDAFADADESLPGQPFLAAAASPYRFWSRRQAHETTMHRVDALAARLGRIPTTTEAGLPTDLAADGIDEFVLGFLPRERTRLRSDRPLTIVVRPVDDPRSWHIRIGSDMPRTGSGEPDATDVTLTGTAAGLHLFLWNRGDDVTTTTREDGVGAAEFTALWRSGAGVVSGTAEPSPAQQRPHRSPTPSG